MASQLQSNERRAIVYARVSSKEQEREGFSIPAQLKLLHDYGQSNALVVVRDFIDVETAKAAGRKNFREMVKFLKAHKNVNVLLVEKTDRLYRNFRDYVELEELGLDVHLVKEGEILCRTSKSHVKFIHGIKVLMAKNYIDNLSEEVKKGMTEKALQGEYPAKAPLGYVNNTQSHLVEADPAKSKFVVRMFELSATGQYSFKRIREQIMSEGLQLYAPKAKLSKSHVEKILKNPFYTGSFLWKGVLYKGTHTPLITRALFDRVQEKLGNRQRPKKQKHTFAFSGLLYCGKCGCMIASEIKKGRYVYYHCTKSKSACDEIYYREEDLAPQFDAIVRGITIDPSIRDWLIQALKESHHDESSFHQDTLARLQAELTKLKTRLDQMYVDKLDGKVTEAFWLEKSRAWGAEQERILDQVRSHQVADRRYYEDGFKLLELASRAHELYSEQDAEQKNKFLGFLLSNCTLKDGTLRPAYRKPFDILARGVENEKWGG